MEEINGDEEFIAKKVIADMVERHYLKGMKGHTGHNSCECCYAVGNGPFGKVDYDYPRSTTGMHRTDHRWRVIAR